jgi:hypothetical protein
MSIAFVSTCKNRWQHLRETLRQNLLDNKLEDTKFVVVDYNSADEMAYEIHRDYQDEMASGKLTYYRYFGEHPFRMAHAKNLAHRLGIREGANVLCNLDADNYTGTNFDAYIRNHFATDRRVLLWANMVKGVMPKGISGRIVCAKEAFLLAGGYDEKYSTYSPDDKDFRARLIRMENEPIEIDPKFLNAIRHTDKMRFKEYPEAADSDAEEFAISQTNRVVNNGYFGCAMVHRNFVPEAIELNPLPTRIFGIGAHKTATTSLHNAFQILGYPSGHWKNAHWAKSIYNQILQEGRSLTLEKCYALCDLPIPFLFRQLDVAYPRSKFILTTRPEKEWLESVRKHWNPEFNPQQAYWKNDPFTKIIHRAVYGQNHFDPEVMIQKYRQHNADVLEYFKDRPDDLLVMDMADTLTSPWAKLCPFLGVRVPNCQYPTSNVAPEKQTEYAI